MTQPCTTSAASSVIAALSRVSPRPGPERVLSEDVRKALASAGLLTEAEVVLTEGRVDLRVQATAIELKVQGSPAAVLRQLQRYGRDASVVDVVLVTSSAKLRAMPSQVEGKTLHVVWLPRL